MAILKNIIVMLKAGEIGTIEFPDTLPYQTYFEFRLNALEKPVQIDVGVGNGNQTYNTRLQLQRNEPPQNIIDETTIAGPPEFYNTLKLKARTNVNLQVLIHNVG